MEKYSNLLVNANTCLRDQQKNAFCKVLEGGETSFEPRLPLSKHLHGRGPRTHVRRQQRQDTHHPPYLCCIHGLGLRENQKRPAQKPSSSGQNRARRNTRHAAARGQLRGGAPRKVPWARTQAASPRAAAAAAEAAAATIAPSSMLSVTAVWVNRFDLQQQHCA